MTFRRTALGLSNLHMFVGVDLIVFTEGGARTISRQQAMTGIFEGAGLDVSFWRELFNRVRPELKIEFREMGSKNALTEIAEDVAKRNISRVCVTRDRDYDHCFSKMPRSPNILYTRSYSWENDLFHARVIEEVFFDIAPVNRNVIKVRKEIQEILKRAFKDLRWLTYADFILCAGGSSLFDRGKPEGAVSSGKVSPVVRREWLTTELQKRRQGIGKFHLIKKQPKLRPDRDCCGKVLLVVVYRILFHLLKKYTNLPVIPKHYAHVLLIKELGEWIASHRASIVSKFYFNRLSKVAL